jgi:hypothetical protein
MRKRVPFLLVTVAAVAGLAGAGRELAHGPYGWRSLHATEFAGDACALYHVMRGLGQDPAADPQNAALVARCRPRSREQVWLLSQSGDALRFDRPSLVRLRVDGVDMAVAHPRQNPPLFVEFPYPPVPVEAHARGRERDGGQRPLDAAASARLARRWNPGWAELFAEWSLGRGEHEVWLGQARIGDARYCSAVEQDPARGVRVCVLEVSDATGAPLSARFPLDERVEWRLEMLRLCRFGGSVRRWRNPLLAAWFGRVEYADAGCLDPAAAPSDAAP